MTDDSRPTCDGWCDKSAPVTHIDQDGFAYCTPCGQRRRQYQPCRKLRPHEAKRLVRGETLTHY